MASGAGGGADAGAVYSLKESIQLTPAEEVAVDELKNLLTRRRPWKRRSLL